ncbi:MAG: peptidoglycan DD-metalloendopeptidase family protein [Chloroflexi bacterium]|nr:peptidoglycan DD-metalloendopeptidase family protein [Chloroflexota bacterium]
MSIEKISEDPAPSGMPGSPDSGERGPQKEETKGLTRIWERLVKLGLGETALRIVTSVVSIALFLVVIWIMANFYLKGQANQTQQSAMAAISTTATPTVAPPPFDPAQEAAAVLGIPRMALIHTILPTRPRFEITKYKVQAGDSIIGIAEKFGLDPRTILWGNYDTLYDNPESLRVDQELNILPIDGVLYKWHAGDGINGVAKFFGVSPDDIIDWPGNHLDRNTLGDPAAPNIAANTDLFIPGGTRQFISWDAPRVTRVDPSAAKGYGTGACTQVVDGAMGTGTFVWPTTEHFISGYHFSPATNHPAIDIGGSLGNAIYATDNGVIVYAGWSYQGYGNMILIDHGNGWQSLYAHLSQINVSCGESVIQGQTIGLMGSTGNSSGPHLHFQLRSDQYGNVDPLNFMK